MKQAGIWGVIAIAGLLLAGQVNPGAHGQQEPSSRYSQTFSPGAATPWVTPTVLPDGQVQLTIYDPATRALAVYLVEKSTGKLMLKSVRNIQWDMQMNAYNTSDPQPLAVRGMLGGQ